MSYPNKTREIAGFVLQSTDYKDRDQIVKVLSPDGIVSIYCRGVQNLKSKNRRLLLPYTEAVFNVKDSGENRELEYLVNGSLKNSYGNITEDLLTSAIGQVFSDLILHSAFEAEIYPLYQQALAALDQPDEARYTRLCLSLALLLKINGIAPNVEECAVCGSRSQIQTLSMLDGGFVCRECSSSQIQRWPKARLRAYRLLFAAGLKDAEKLHGIYAFELNDLMFLSGWFKEYMALDLASFKFLDKIYKLYQ